MSLFSIFFRFNRYIVECKFVKDFYNGNDYYGFNRYIVECKLEVTAVIFFVFKI